MTVPREELGVIYLKRISALALCVVLLFSLAMPVGAKNFEYTVSGSELVITAPASDAVENAMVSVDGHVVEARFSSAAAENIPVTYAVLLDCSSAKSNYQKEQEQAALQALASHMRPGDRLLPARMYQSKLILGSVLSNPEEISNAVNEPLEYAWGVAMYSSIVEILNVLKDEETYPGMKCVVIIGDGRDDQQTTVRAEHARAAMAASDIPVIGIAVQDQFPANNIKIMVDNFMKLCRETDGGAGVVMEPGQMDADGAAAYVTERMQNRTVIKLDARKLERSGDTMEVVIAAGDTVTTVVIPTDVLPAYVPPVTEPPTEEPTYAPAESAIAGTEPAAQTETGKTDVLPQLNSATTFYLLIGGGIAAVVIAVVILILIFRPQEEDLDEEEKAAVEDLEFMKIPEFTEGQVASLQIPDDLYIEEPTKLTVPEVQADNMFLPTACTVRLVSAQDNRTVQELRLDNNASKTFGRNSRSDIILCGTDHALSGLHFELLWDGIALQIRDCGSTNGTLVNDTALQPDTWTMVANGGTIQAGSTLYTVLYETEIA